MGGDIARRNMILQVNWPQTATVDDSAGTRMIDFIELRYDNVLIERHYGESIEIFNDLRVPQGKQSALTTLVGKNTTSNLAAYNILLPFSIDLPLCALKQAPVLRVKFLPSNQFSSINWTAPIQVNLFVDYVYVSKAEREYFRANPIFYPAETIQRLEFGVPENTSVFSFASRFTRPVKELYWVIQNTNASAYDFTNNGSEQLVSLKLEFNGVEIIPNEIGVPLFLRATQGLEFHTRAPDRKFYMYSFALDPESKHPSGEVNLSAILRQIHTLTLSSAPILSRNVRVYALTYQVLQLKDGHLVSLTDASSEAGFALSRQVSSTSLFSKLSQSAISSMLGAFSLKSLSGIPAKVLQVLAYDGTVQDFWADSDGNLKTAPVNGTPYDVWIVSHSRTAGDASSILTWYDQSPLQNHMSSPNGHRPLLFPSTFYLGPISITTSTLYYFNIPTNSSIGPVPYSNNLNYTVTIHHNVIYGDSTFCQVQDLTNGSKNSFGTVSGNYVNSWGSSSIQGGTVSSGNKLTFVWDGANRTIYRNGTQVAQQASSGWLEQTSSNQTLGGSGQINMFSLFTFNSALSDPDRTLVETYS